MGYCYCMPSRTMTVQTIRAQERARYASLPVGEGVSPHSYYVKGSRGWEVSRPGREIALRAWATRRQRSAERKAADEASRRPGHAVIGHCDEHPEQEAPVEQPTTMVIEGTPAPGATPVPQPVALTR